MRYLSAFLLLVPSGLFYGQTLTGTSLVLTGPYNSQEIGGTGTGGDSSCPVLSTLSSSQFATCYFAATGSWQLGYTGGAYSPIARLSDVQTSQAAMTAQISTVQSTTTSLQSSVGGLQTSFSNMQSSVSTLQQQVAAQQTSSTGSPTFLDVVSSNALNLGSGFNTVLVAGVNQDTASAFNRQTGLYTVPTSGYYLCVAKLRFADNVPGQINYGLGVGTTNLDNPSFTWFLTNSSSSGYSRNGASNSSIGYFTAGQQIRMYAYVDAATTLPVNSAELSIVKLGQ